MSHKPPLSGNVEHDRAYYSPIWRGRQLAGLSVEDREAGRARSPRAGVRG
jgi:hypothetical protein